MPKQQQTHCALVLFCEAVVRVSTLILGFVVLHHLSICQINGYARIGAISGSNVYVRSLSETYDAFVAGEEIVLMQMQADVIGSNTANNSSFGNLSAIGAAGLYEIRQITSITSSTGNSIWLEDFTLSDGVTSDAGATAWSRTFTSGGTGSGSSVNSNQYWAIRGTTVWTSESIDISQYYDVDVSVSISESGTLEASDCITIQYVLDGGTATNFTTNGNVCDDFTATTATASNLNGYTLQIIISTVSNGSSETHYWDNVALTGDQRIFTLSTSPSNTYTIGTNASVQAITFPTLGTPNYTTTGNITAVDWNGEYGGVAALKVAGTLTLSHNITANGQGFRGGAQDNNGTAGSCDGTTYRIGSDLNYAYKGEGIYRITNTSYEKAIGKVINGGGGANMHNGGGGGGGNYTAGGNGGPGWDGSAGGCSPTGGGTGGISLSSHISASRVFMGGGGGAGEGNNNYNTSGGDGGGIILLKAETLQTTGSCGGRVISANGDNGYNHGGNDGTGGGGAGGSVVMQVNSYSIGGSCALTISANGGNGSSVVNAAVHGAGGGGGQGAVIYNSTQPTTNITTNTIPGTGGCNNTGCSSSAASGSGTANTSIVTESVGPLPVELIQFSGVISGHNAFLSWKTATEINSSYFEVERFDEQHELWNSVCLVNAAGYSNRILEYQCTDTKPMDQKTYYRLAMYDLDGSITYSGVIILYLNANSGFPKFEVYPIPAGSRLFISFAERPGQVNITLTDVKGNIYTPEVLQESPFALSIRLAGMPSGLYTLMLSHPGGTELRRLSIVK